MALNALLSGAFSSKMHTDFNLVLYQEAVVNSPGKALALENEPMKRAPNPVDKHVGSRVRMRRVLLGFTQEKLGTALGITFQQVQKYEKGTNRIGASRLQEISKTLQVPPSFFFEGLPATAMPEGAGFAEAGTAKSVTDFVITAEGLQLNKAFTQIKDPKVRRRIIDLVIALASASGSVEKSL